MVSGQGSTLIGAAVKRKEDPRLLTGAGTYTGDVQLRGMTYMAVLRSPHAHAHIRRIEPARARQQPGVLAVLIGHEVAHQCQRPFPLAGVRDGMHTKSRWPLATAVAKYAGEPVAAVVATSRERAQDALDLIEVEYETLPAVMDLEKALTGTPVVEVAPRIPVQAGPFGIAASPDSKFVAVTARQNNRTGVEGNTISIIDVDLARQGLPGAEAARVQVGTDGGAAQARPFSVAWTPDGKEILVGNTRVNNVSIIDVGLALAHKPGAEIARIPLTRPDGAPARPKVAAVTSEGRYAVVTGGDDTLAESATNPTGMVYVIDLRSRSVAAQITKVGIDPYGVTIVDDANLIVKD